MGNRCHVDCAHQGHCDHHSGTCHCFPGQYGSDCSLQLEVPVSLYYSPGGVYSAADPAALIGDEEQGWEDFADTLTTN